MGQSYERTCPVFNGTCRGTSSAPGATIHLTVGTAGVGYDSTAWRNVTWSAAHLSSVFGYGRAAVLNSTSLHWQLVDSMSGRILDDVVIHSNHSFEPPGARQ